MEILEEHRDLSLEEWNFKDILNERLVALVHQQKIYWKQRGTVRWVKFGDAGTSFFTQLKPFGIEENLSLLSKLKVMKRSLIMV